MIKAKAVFPGPFDAKAFQKEFLLAAVDTTDAWEKTFRLTHRNWRDIKPSWKKDVKIRFSSLEFYTETSNDVYRFLNDGTDVRYAVMTPDFVSKTAPGRLKSLPGRGGFSHFDFNYQRAAARGIKAREWDKQVANRSKKDVYRRFNKAAERGVVGSGHQYT